MTLHQADFAKAWSHNADVQCRHPRRVDRAAGTLSQLLAGQSRLTTPPPTTHLALLINRYLRPLLIVIVN